VAGPVGKADLPGREGSAIASQLRSRVESALIVARVVRQAEASLDMQNSGWLTGSSTSRLFSTRTFRSLPDLGGIAHGDLRLPPCGRRATGGPYVTKSGASGRGNEDEPGEPRTAASLVTALVGGEVFSSARRAFRVAVQRVKPTDGRGTRVGAASARRESASPGRHTLKWARRRPPCRGGRSAPPRPGGESSPGPGDPAGVPGEQPVS